MNLRMPTLKAIRRCFEGAVPAQIATCAPDGTPNVAYLSQVHYVDETHVALSFQFFSKTRENVLANPYAMAQVIDPDTGEHYRLSLNYLRTETEGPLFQYMKARLAGVASHTGMSKVFVLRGADVYRVLALEAPAAAAHAVAAPASMLPALRACSARLAACADLDALLDQLLAGLAEHFDVAHAMVLMFDAANRQLYTVASLGYAQSGVGSEIPLGAGLIGVAAQEKTPIRIGFMTHDYAYHRAQRVPDGDHVGEKEIPFPGLVAPHSQLAVPIVNADRLLGVLYLESEQSLRFTYEHEDAFMALAAQLGFAMQLLEQNADRSELAPVPARAEAASGEAVVVRRYAADNSVFVQGDYLIKGVAGAILWKLLSDHAQGRRDFSNRELRLDAKLGLPDVSDNLEARLILLQRRLQERCPYLRIEKTGRGRFRLVVDRPVRLDPVS